LPTEKPVLPAANQAATDPLPPAIPAAAAKLSAVDIAAVRREWPRILSRVEAKNAGAFSLLREALPDRIEGNKLLLDFPPALSMFMSSVLNPDQYKTMIENCVNSVLKASLSIGGFIGAERELTPDEAAAEDASAPLALPTPEVAVEESSLF
jgi:hypothetical protein